MPTSFGMLAGGSNAAVSRATLRRHGSLLLGRVALPPCCVRSTTTHTNRGIPIVQSHHSEAAGVLQGATPVGCTPQSELTIPSMTNRGGREGRHIARYASCCQAGALLHLASQRTMSQPTVQAGARFPGDRWIKIHEGPGGLESADGEMVHVFPTPAPRSVDRVAPGGACYSGR